MALETDAAPTLSLAFARLSKLLTSGVVASNASPGGLLRIEVEVSAALEPAFWLAHQRVCPRVYLSNQDKSLRAAGVGEAKRISSAGMFGDLEWAAASRILDGASPRARFYGGIRFDSEASVTDEWRKFGGSVFILPLVDLQVCGDGRCYVGCQLVFDHGTAAKAQTIEAASRQVLAVLQDLHWAADVVSPVQQVLPTLVAHEASLSAGAWDAAVKTVLQGIDDGKWSKVVLAQRVNLEFSARLEPMYLLLRLLDADDAAVANTSPHGMSNSAKPTRPRHAYLFLLQLDEQTAFMGCTPEKLFKLAGDELSTEALAGTRPRGETMEVDNALAADLLHCEKDLREVNSVRDFLVRTLQPVCTELDHSSPFVLQLRHVQHICVPFRAKMARSRDESMEPARAALSILHPTPAVCGAPSDAARKTIRELESFDRGFYAGPLGYLASDGCEFCVAIRSALIHASQVAIFAGAGIVRGSTATSEWEEVHVKMKNFVSLFPNDHNLQSPAPPTFVDQLPNLNAVSATIFVEELLRCGLGHVVMCPGSRCTPLTVAVARSGCPHSLANDERGAGFMALGFARASGRCAAVIVTSGTAVANLLPAVVEAAQDHVPLLLLTADRPPEARDTAANQTVNQVGMLGGSGCLRWFKDMPCPSPDMAFEPLLSDASYALARAAGPAAGPVQLNFMFREPLAPSEQPWPRDILTKSKRVSRWLRSRQPFTNYMRPYAGLPLVPDAQLLPVLDIIHSASRGIIVAGSTSSLAQQQAVAAFAVHTGWPLIADVCSGLRSDTFTSREGLRVAPFLDIMLSGGDGVANRSELDVVIQVGGRLVSKRVQEFVATATEHVLIEEHGERSDPHHSVTHRLQGDLASVLGALHYSLQQQLPSRDALTHWVAGSKAAAAAIDHFFDAAGNAECLSEIWVARHIADACKGSVDGEIIFSSNSLPIRHLDMYCPSASTVLSNRGASGIDGIIHTATGAALGAGARCTLLIGDLATLHDVNALATAKKAAVALVIVILNNAGGGIFRFLPVANFDDVFSPYFDTPHQHDFGPCCEGFGIPYTLVTTRAEFENAYERARRDASGPHVIEVKTDKEAGHALSKRVQELARDAARECFPKVV